MTKKKPVIPRVGVLDDVKQRTTFLRNKFGSQRARKFVAAYRAAMGLVKDHPGSGSNRMAEELNFPGLKVWDLENEDFSIYYREEPNFVDVLVAADSISAKALLAPYH